MASTSASDTDTLPFPPRDEVLTPGVLVLTNTEKLTLLLLVAALDFLPVMRDSPDDDSHYIRCH